MKNGLWMAALLLTAAAAGAAEDIAKIDRNFAEVKVENRPVRYYDALNDPNFVITGFAWRKPGEPLLRIHARTRAEAEALVPQALAAHEIADGPVAAPPLVL